jgi:glucose/mannose transport system substrate-binding protein
MMDLFEESEMQLPSIAHGLAVPPDVQSEIENTFATFNGSWDVEETYQELVSAFDE